MKTFIHRRIVPDLPTVAAPDIVDFDLCIPNPGTGSREPGTGRGRPDGPFLLVKLPDETVNALPEETVAKREGGGRALLAPSAPAVTDDPFACELLETLLDVAIDATGKGPAFSGCDLITVEVAVVMVSISVGGTTAFPLQPNAPVNLLLMLTLLPSSTLLVMAETGLVFGGCPGGGKWPGGGRKTPLSTGR